MTPNKNFLIEALYTSFIVASGTEELFKFIILYFLVWKNKNFNEPFDGIVYAVFISLGFAGIENVLYIFNPYLGGYQTAIARAIFSVPGHGLFGVSMGYYYAIAKFNKTTLVTAFSALFIHGIYDFILISNISFLMILCSFCSIFVDTRYEKSKEHIQQSPFKPRIDKKIQKVSFLKISRLKNIKKRGILFHVMRY